MHKRGWYNLQTTTGNSQMGCRDMPRELQSVHEPPPREQTRGLVQDRRH